MKKLIIAFTALISLSSCKKNLMEKYEAANSSNGIETSTKKFEDLKTDENFDWKTNKKIDFTFEGYETIGEIKTTLLITSEDGKQTYYSGLVNLNSTLHFPIQVPSHIKNIKVSYGAIQKSFSTLAPIITFNCFPENQGE